MKMDGFKDLEKQLKKIEKNIKKQTDEYVSLADLFNDTFMRKYTKLQTWNEFLEGLPDGNFENLLEQQPDVVNSFVAENTNFNTWDKMLKTAGELRMANKIKKLF